MSEILSLLYVSSAVRVLSSAEIYRLLATARQRNMRHAVTGVLLHCDGSFMQYIEGPHDGVEHIYRVIRNDVGHRGFIEISREVITEREFGDWSMAFLTTEVDGYPWPAEEHALFCAVPQVLNVGDSPPRLLLRNFWNRALRR